MRRVTALLLPPLLVIGACGHRQTPRLVVAWRWTAPQPAYVGMPSATAHDVYATYGHSVLVAIDGATGDIRWTSRRVGLRDVAPTPTRDRVLAATDDGVVGFARDDGRVVWEAALGQRPSTPIVAGDAVLVTTWEGRLVSVGRWTIDLPGPSLGPPASDGGIVVASWDAGVLAADAATGRVRWRHAFGAAGTSAPAVGAGVAVVVGGDRRAHAYDLVSGRERWSHPTRGAGAPEAPPAAAGQRVAMADRHGDLVVADTGSGRVRWRATGDGAVERGGPVFVGDVVALPLDDGRIMVATSRGRVTDDPSGRVSGVTATGPRAVFATREARTNGLTALDIVPGG